VLLPTLLLGGAIVLVATLLILPTLRALDDTASPAGPADLSDEPGIITSAPCPFPVVGPKPAVRVECGWLGVPERRDVPDSPTIHLAVALLRSPSANPRPDPVLYLEGGPGGSSLWAADLWTYDPLLAERDIVLLDQRGTGYSLPSLHCDELYSDRFLRAVEACRRRLDAEGVDRTAYTTAAIAADVADLRIALGVAEWNLWGSSYGTRISLAVLRDHPAGIRSVVLESPYPMQIDAYADLPRNSSEALAALFAACAEDAGCATAHPDLEATFLGLVGTLHEHPRKVRIPDPEPGRPRTLLLDGATLVEELLAGLADTAVNPLLPDWLARLADGQLILLGDYVDERYGAGEPGRAPEGPVGAVPAPAQPAHPELGSDPVFWSVECAEEIDHSRVARSTGDLEAAVAAEAPAGAPDGLVAAAIRLVVDTYAACDLWDIPAAPAVEDEPVSSDVPTMVLSGSFDSITPPRWAAAAAASLSRAQLFTYPGFGHGIVDFDPCPQQMVRAFLAAPTQPVDADCIEALGGPYFDVDAG
jgi:pimeloyl-ACP methyl ester carboxylesterase